MCGCLGVLVCWGLEGGQDVTEASVNLKQVWVCVAAGVHA